MNNLDSKRNLLEHRSKIRESPKLKFIYNYFYDRITDKIVSGWTLEIGSGGGFLKQRLKSKLVTSDIISGPGIDRVFSAEKLPYKNSFFKNIVMLNVFHHIKNPGKALIEFERCLSKGGRIVMVEPWNSVWGRFIYTNFHHEKFNPTQKGWNIEGDGRLSDANGAIPWIIFSRDRSYFTKTYKHLEIVEIKPFCPLSYLLTGGLSHKTTVPLQIIKFISRFEQLVSSIIPDFSMFALIVIRKKSQK